MSDTTNEQPGCVGCGANKDDQDLYEYPDGARCYDCCGRREREAADAWQQMSLADRIAFGAAHGSAHSALLVAFIQGAKWWEWHNTGATMSQSDQHEAEGEANRRAKNQTLGRDVLNDQAHGLTPHKPRSQPEL